MSEDNKLQLYVEVDDEHSALAKALPDAIITKLHGLEVNTRKYTSADINAKTTNKPPNTVTNPKTPPNGDKPKDSPHTESNPKTKDE